MVKKLSGNSRKVTLNVLGYAPDIINTLLELADLSENIQSFSIIENIHRITDEHYIPIQRYEVNFLDGQSKDTFLSKDGPFAFGVSGPRGKKIVFEFFKNKFGISDKIFINLIHPGADVSHTAKLNNGIQIGVFSAVNAVAEIGFGVNIKSSSYIGHHTIIGDYVEINPGVTIGGLVEIGSNTVIGAGAIIRNKIKIGSNCIIGMGSNVTKDIPDNTVAFGNPCKVLRQNE